jgi:AcrR family transcriptional regulator
MAELLPPSGQLPSGGAAGGMGEGTVMAADTRAKLLAGALETLRSRGIAGTSARSIASAAGVNQALVFYHFGSVDELLAAAVQHGAQQRVATYRERLGSVTSLRELLDLGRSLHADELAAGNLAVLAQMLAGARTDARLGPATAAGLGLWVAEIEAVLRRILENGPLAEFVELGGLARAVAAAFIGLELYEGVDADGADCALGALEQLATLTTMLEALGPVARKTISRRTPKVARR